jgi:hypothetical protein
MADVHRVQTNQQAKLEPGVVDTQDILENRLEKTGRKARFV